MHIRPYAAHVFFVDMKEYVHVLPNIPTGLDYHSNWHHGDRYDTPETQTQALAHSRDLRPWVPRLRFLRDAPHHTRHLSPSFSID